MKKFQSFIAFIASSWVIYLTYRGVDTVLKAVERNGFEITTVEIIQLGVLAFIFDIILIALIILWVTEK